MLNPTPVVMVSCRGAQGERAKDNIVTAAWVGTVCSEPPMVGVALRKSRFSHGQIAETGELVVNLVDRAHAKGCDLCGVKSGRDVDKWQALGYRPIPVEGLAYARAIDGCPVHIGCRVKQILELGSHDLFLCEVVTVCAEEELFDETGKLCLDLADLIAYCHGDYVTLGERIGFFGYSVAGEKALHARLGGAARHASPAVPAKGAGRPPRTSGAKKAPSRRPGKKECINE